MTPEQSSLSMGNKTHGEETGRAFHAALCALLLTCIFTATVFSGCGKKVALLVNGESIYWNEYEEEYSRRISSIERESPDELKGKRGEELREETGRQVATDLVRDRLTEQKARSLDVEVEEKAVDERMRSERRNMGEEQFRNMLKDSGMNEGQYKQQLARQLLIDGLGAAVTAGLTVTQEEAKEYFEKNRDYFSRGETVRLAHILVDTEGQAKVITGEAEKGADWDHLAREFSQDVTTRDNGGDMGWFERGTVDPALEGHAFSLSVGEVAGPIQSSDGYHIIMVLDRKEAHAPTFEEIEKEVREELLKEKKEEKFQLVLNSLYADAKVVVKIDDWRWDPDLGMVVKGGEG